MFSSLKILSASMFKSSEHCLYYVSEHKGTVLLLMKLKVIEISLMIAVVVAVLYSVVLNNDSSELSDKLIRLHVVANSDTDEDQELKLMVRDAVLEEIDGIMDGDENRDEVQEKLEDSLTVLQEKAQETVIEQGYTEPVAVTLEQEHFPTRIYDTFSLPAGEYTSLRVSIGEAGGRNWWCVVFPPLCVEAAEGEEALEASGLTDEEVALITEENTGYAVKFKALEILDSIKSALK